MIQVSILYEKGCPYYQKACTVICKTFGHEGLSGNIELKEFNHLDQQEQIKFKGSPTVLVNGMDVEQCFTDKNDSQKSDFEVIELGVFEISTTSCRIYNCDNGIGCPSHEMIDCCIEFCYPSKD